MSKPIKIGLLGGTGLDQDGSLLTERKLIPVLDTPYGPPSDNELIEGTVAGLTVYIMGRHGRNHDKNPTNVNYRANLWTFKQLGCQIVLVTTACGSLREEIAPGHFALLDQYIDRTTGKRENSFYTVSHIPQGHPFDSTLQKMLAESLEELDFPYHRYATCVTIEGPRFSTLAESQLYRSWGAHIVNMTTVPEAPLAAELGLIYGSLSLVTDYDCWHCDEEETVSVELVGKRMQELATKARQVLAVTLAKISQHDWSELIEKRQKSALGAIMCK